MGASLSVVLVRHPAKSMAMATGQYAADSDLEIAIGLLDSKGFAAALSDLDDITPALGEEDGSWGRIPRLWDGRFPVSGLKIEIPGGDRGPGAGGRFFRDMGCRMRGIQAYEVEIPIG